MELFKRYHSIANQTVYTLPTGEKVYPAVVDVKKGMQGGGDISYVETDNNVGFIIVSLVEGESKFKIPSTATVTCNIKRPDGHFLEIGCTKMDESTVQIALGSAGTKVEGVHSFDIKIQYSDDIVIGTPIMSYMVQSGLTLDGAIEEDERLPMLTALIEEVKTIHESTTELAEEVSELSENIGAVVEGAGARLDEEIAEFRSQSEELIASANSAVEEVNNSLEQITTSIEEVNQGIDEVNDAISEVNTALEEVNSNMDRIDSVIIEANQAIESMEDTQNTSKELNEQSEMLISEMQGLIADGLDIEELITARDGEESLSARLDRDLQGVYEYVDNKQVDLSPVESKIAENTKKLNTHERLIDNNLNSIGSLNTRITNNTKTLTNHSTEIANTKQEITTKVNALKTEIGEDIASINDDVARIQAELAKTENTKYSTENGVKEFTCRDGYVDNVVIEGQTKILNNNNEEVEAGLVGAKLVSVGQGDKIEVLTKNSDETKQDKKQISTTLRSLPNGVKDTIEKRGNKYVKVQRCGEVTLNGSEDTTSFHSPNNNTSSLYRRVGFKVKNIPKSNVPCYCDKLNSIIDYEIEDYNVLPYGAESCLFITIPVSNLTSSDGEGAKEWLQSNPITVVYELETPIITELPNFNPQTFEGDTTLLLNTGVIQGECEFEVTNSMGSEIEVLKNNAGSMANSISNMDNSINRIDNSISRIDNSISGIQKIHYSTVTPSSAEGKDGDLWVIYK